MGSEEQKFRQTDWAHSPTHRFVAGEAYIVTAGTYLKQHYFRSPERRTFLMGTLLEQAAQFDWSFQAWAVFSNHYHFVALAPEDADTLVPMLRAVHSKTARYANEADGLPGRKIWYQYRDTCLTNDKSYYARLNYVHHNPERHGLVRSAEDYRWCSMGWFLREAEPNFRKMVLSFKYDRISIDDDF